MGFRRKRTEDTGVLTRGGTEATPAGRRAERDSCGHEWTTGRQCVSVFAVSVWARAGCEIRAFEPCLCKFQKAKLPTVTSESVTIFISLVLPWKSGAVSQAETWRLSRRQQRGASELREDELPRGSQAPSADWPRRGRGGGTPLLTAGLRSSLLGFHATIFTDRICLLQRLRNLRT